MDGMGKVLNFDPWTLEVTLEKNSNPLEFSKNGWIRYPAA